MIRSTLASTVALIALVAQPLITRLPYLQQETAHSALIAWRTSTPVKESVVIEKEDQPSSIYVQTSDDHATLHHALTIKGLDADTRYQYQIRKGVEPVTHWISFKTFPENQHANFSFAILGDSGTASEAQKEVAKQLFRANPDFVIHTGDVIYGGKDDRDFDEKFFAIYASLAEHVPFFMSLGNHDTGFQNGIPYLSNFYLPQNSPGMGRYYSFDYGQGHFVALDSNESMSTDSPQYQWLERDLHASRAALKVIYFHHPLYSTGFHGSTLKLRRILVPLFEREHVTMVFNGHDHDYERSQPLHGITYVVTGGGGAALYPAEGGPWTAETESTYNFVLCKVNDRKLHLDTIGADGKIFDRDEISF